MVYRSVLSPHAAVYGDELYGPLFIRWNRLGRGKSCIEASPSGVGRRNVVIKKFHLLLLLPPSQAHASGTQLVGPPTLS